MRIGQFTYRFRWLVVAFWVSLTAALLLLAPPADKTVGETSDLLPATTPVHVALDEMARHFGDKAGLSDADVVFERASGPLTADDLAAIEHVATELKQSAPSEGLTDELRDVSVRTPAELHLAGKGNPLISADGQAALIGVALPYNFITQHAARVVKHFQDVLAATSLPPGLSAAVTGSAGYGYDYAIATERSHTKTTVVTLISVILILLAIYRAPIVAAIPLAGISLAAGVVLSSLGILETFGLHSGMAERIFTFVLLYGAGIDYSLLFISRYREFLNEGRDARSAMAEGLDSSFVAIASSTVMTFSGLVMLCFAQFSVFRHSGPAICLALIVASMAATTLVPAMIAIIGPRAFWPRRLLRSPLPLAEGQGEGKLPNASLDRNPATAAKSSHPNPVARGERADAALLDVQEENVAKVTGPTPFRAWTWVADRVVERPLPVLMITLALLVLPALRGLSIHWTYDALYSLKSTYPARQGTEMVQRHWPVGETAPVTVLIVANQAQPLDTWRSAASKVASALAPLPQVGNVRSILAPLGVHVSPLQNAALLMFAPAKVESEYLSADRQAMRLSVILDIAPLSQEAMSQVSAIRTAAASALKDSGFPCTLHLAGSTAEMMDIRAITQRDFKRLAAMALTAIVILVIAVLRDVGMSVFIVAATVLSYLTTVGLTYWFFAAQGATGLEWKVQMLLFIVLVAVGQDYSIFFAVRFAQEARTLPCRDATRRALIFTGPVISSCGLIMAATLGSIIAGDVQTLVQLGFALALGMLIDTFLIRPLLLPAFIVLTGRTLSKAAGFVG